MNYSSFIGQWNIEGSVWLQEGGWKESIEDDFLVLTGRERKAYFCMETARLVAVRYNPSHLIQDEPIFSRRRILPWINAWHISPPHITPSKLARGMIVRYFSQWFGFEFNGGAVWNRLYLNRLKTFHSYKPENITHSQWEETRKEDIPDSLLDCLHETYAIPAMFQGRYVRVYFTLDKDKSFRKHKVFTIF